jgi:hypothetical protein
LGLSTNEQSLLCQEEQGRNSTFDLEKNVKFLSRGTVNFYDENFPDMGTYWTTMSTVNRDWSAACCVVHWMMMPLRRPVVASLFDRCYSGQQFVVVASVLDRDR